MSVCVCVVVEEENTYKNELLFKVSSLVVSGYGGVNRTTHYGCY